MKEIPGPKERLEKAYFAFNAYEMNIRSAKEQKILSREDEREFGETRNAFVKVLEKTFLEALLEASVFFDDSCLCLEWCHGVNKNLGKHGSTCLLDQNCLMDAVMSEETESDPKKLAEGIADFRGKLDDPTAALMSLNKWIRQDVNLMDMLFAGSGDHAPLDTKANDMTRL